MIFITVHGLRFAVDRWRKPEPAEAGHMFSAGVATFHGIIIVAG
jgi:hypothetical protein